MAIKLESVQCEHFYKMGDESGYKYEIHAIKDEERGWSAHVTLESFGYNHAEDAVAHLRYAAEHFLRQLNEGVSK